MNATTFARAIPGLAEQFKEAPAGYVSPLQVLVQGLDYAGRVSCPCGAHPELKVLSMKTCDCGRVFMYAGGDRLYVASSPLGAKSA